MMRAMRRLCARAGGLAHGIDQPGRHAVDGDRRVGQLMRQRPREPAERGLGRHHVGAVGRPGVRRHAADVDHAAGTALAQVRQRRLRAMERAVDADRVGSLPVGIAQRVEWRLQADRRVVDDDVQAAEALRDRRDHRVDLGALGHVGERQQRLAAASEDLVDHGLALLPAGAHVDRDLRARVGQRQRDGAPDVAAGTGDQRDPTLQRCGVHGHLLADRLAAQRVQRHAGAVRRPRRTSSACRARGSSQPP